MNAITNQIDELRHTAELVRAAQTGDREAFGQLFEKYEKGILAIAMRRLNDFGQAQELCQDVFVQAMQKLDQLRTPECFGAWLRSITVRMAINRQIRRGPDVAVEPEMLAATVVDRADPVNDALLAERRDQIRDGLEKLREMDRETLVAFYINGQSLIEMSEQFDAPIGTIKRRLHVARKRLAKEVDELATV